MMGNTHKSKTSLSLRLFTGTYLFPFLCECFLRSHQGTIGKPAGAKRRFENGITSVRAIAAQLNERRTKRLPLGVVATTSVTTTKLRDEAQRVPSAPRFARKTPAPYFRKGPIKPRSCLGGRPSVRFTPDSDRLADIAPLPTCANSGQSALQQRVSLFDHISSNRDQRWGANLPVMEATKSSRYGLFAFKNASRVYPGSR